MQVTWIETDENFMELREHGTPDFPIEYYLDEIERYELGYVPMHWHREFELLLVRSGEIDCGIGEDTIRLKAGEGMFIGSNVFHQFHVGKGGGAVVPNILFAPEFFADESSRVYQKYIRPFLQGDISYALLRPETEWQQEVIQNLQLIFRQFEDGGETDELKLQEKVIAVWRQLYTHREHMRRERNRQEEAASARVKVMAAYIKENYAKKQTLEDIARAANISKTEALRCFKRCMNISPVNYLLRHRLQTAERMLRRTRKKISEIAGECGFDNVSYFDRMFRRVFGRTPSEYRKGYGYYNESEK